MILVLLIVLLPLYFIIKTSNEAIEGTASDEGASIITSERRDNPTPNGGDYSEIFYFDDDGNSVDKTAATRAIVKEYKNDGTVVNEVFAFIDRSK